MGGKVLRGTEKDITARIRRAKKILFFLDYDGTLVPIRKKPSLARLARKKKLFLKKLASRTRIKVFIISGRSLENVKRLVGIKRIACIGNHGIELEGPGVSYVNKKAKAIKPLVRKIYRELKKVFRGKKYKGVLLEDKGYTLSFHYRMARRQKIPLIKKLFKDTIAPYLAGRRIRITEGKKIFEVRPNIDWHKGKILNWALKRFGPKGSLVICIGDDRTDEDAFRALGGKGVSILVSKKKKKTSAQYRLRSPEEVMKFLKGVIARAR